MHTISTCFVGQNMTDIDNVIFFLLRKIIKGHSSPFLDKTDKNYMFVIQTSYTLVCGNQRVAFMILQEFCPLAMKILPIIWNLTTKISTTCTAYMMVIKQDPIGWQMGGGKKPTDF